MPENSAKIPENFREISIKNSIFDAGDNVSYTKNPRKLWSISEMEGAEASYILVAMALAEYSISKRHFPVFSISRSKLAKKTLLSERTITNAIKFLTLNKVLSASFAEGWGNQYTWNEEFLEGVETISPVPVKQFQGNRRNDFRGTGETIAPFYIQFSLELFYNSYKDFFAPHQPPYRFYVPKKRKKKSGEFNDVPQGSGTIEVPRKDAWRDACFKVYEEIKNYDDALSRIFLALRASKSVEDVQHPETVMRYRVTNHANIHELRSNSGYREHLYNDVDFKSFVDSKQGSH